MASARPIPAGCEGLIPFLCIRGASSAIEFYKKAFGAKEISRLASPDGSVLLHAEIEIAGSKLYLCDEVPHMQRWLSPQAFGGTTSAVHRFVEDIDAVFEQAVAAGATISMPPWDSFWGDRFGKLTDPFGHEWSFATRKQDLSPEQILIAMNDFFAKMAAGHA